MPSCRPVPARVAGRPDRPRALACAVVSIVAAALLAGCGEEPPKAKRMQTVKLLPDTPPPPPPPPPPAKPEEKRPEQKKDEAPPPVPQAQPEQQALKTDEAAGTGPGSGLVAGSVTQDYTDQKIGDKPQIGGGGTDMAARLAATSYASAVTRSLNDFLARERELKRGDFRARVHVWLSGSGALERVELIGSTGDAATDRALRDALQRFPGSGAPPPPALQQPLRLQVTNRMLG